MERRKPASDRWREDFFSDSHNDVPSGKPKSADADPVTRAIRKDVFSFMKKADALESGSHISERASANSEPCVWQEGQRVKHKLFGVGIILGVEKSLDGFRLEVKFPLVGTKKLLHTYLQPE